MKKLVLVIGFICHAEASADLFERRDKIETTLIGSFGGVSLPKESNIYARTSGDVELQCPAIQAYNSFSHRYAVFALPSMPTIPFLPTEEGTQYFISIASRDMWLEFRPHSFIDPDAPRFLENPGYNMGYAVEAFLYGLDGAPIGLSDTAGISIHGNGQDIVMSPDNMKLMLPDDTDHSIGIYSVCKGNNRRAVTYHWLVGSNEATKMEGCVLGSFTLDEFLAALKENFQGTPEYQAFMTLFL